MLDKLRVHFVTMLTDPMIAVGLIVVIIAGFLLMIFDQLWLAVGLLVGFVSGMGNFYMLDRFFRSLGSQKENVSKAQIALNSTTRLMAVTAIAIICYFINKSLALGIMVALLGVQFLIVGRFMKLAMRLYKTKV